MKLKQRTRVWAMGLGAVLLILGCCQPDLEAAEKKPNIILIVADDLGYRNLGCYGQKHIQTPCLDQMATAGLKFTRFYAGNLLCLPSRVCLMTGLHSGHSRVRVNGGLKNFDKEFDNNGELEGFKGSFTEGGLRVPCIAYWPGRIKPGGTSEELLAFWDFMPTFAELAGIKPPQPIDGISFVPTLTEEGQQVSHKYLYFTMGSSKKKSGRSYIVRGKGETRDDQAIEAEANTDVVVPKFAP